MKPSRAVVLVVLAACTRRDPPPAPAPVATGVAPTPGSVDLVPSAVAAPAPAACPRPLAQFCKEFPCEYEALRAYARKFERCTRGESGTCGGQRYVLFEAYDGGYVAYFDASGKAVGVQSHSDMLVPGACWDYGSVSACEQKRTEHLCGLRPGQRSE